ncbi:MAG: dTDP-4-dehydrorhamnose reductase [Candidatus Ratteibacteria bacterium]
MKKLKILITGHRGMLGTDLMASLIPSFNPIGLDLPEFNITQKENTLNAITAVRPDLVIHAAAYTDVDGCEKRPEKAFAVNTQGTANVVGACADLKIPLVYISTDFVFDGKKKSPYREYDPTNPIQVYGRSKLAGEFYVSRLLKKFFIVRTSWLFGKHGKSFPTAILDQAKKGGELRVVTDQTGSPTLTTDLCRGIIKIISEGEYGIYHAANQGGTSWFEFATAILSGAGKKNLIQPIYSKELKRAATRPAYSVLKNSVLENFLNFQMPDWQDALKRFLTN